MSAISKLTGSTYVHVCTRIVFKGSVHFCFCSVSKFSGYGATTVAKDTLPENVY